MFGYEHNPWRECSYCGGPQPCPCTGAPPPQCCRYCEAPLADEELAVGWCQECARWRDGLVRVRRVSDIPTTRRRP